MGPKIRIGVGSFSTPSTPAPSWDPDAQAYFSVVESRGGTISTANKTKIQDFIIYLRDLCPTGNQWQNLVRFKCFKTTSQIAALTDIKAPSSDIAIAVNGPTFEVDNGYLFDGVSQYIRSQFTPGNHGENIFTANYASWGANQRGRTNNADFGAPSGCYDSNYSTIAASQQQYGLMYWINAPVGGAYLTAGLGDGPYMLGRNMSSTKFLVPQGYSTNGGMPSGGLPYVEMYISAINGNGAPTNFANGYKDWWFAGAGALDFNELNYAINTFLLA